jgi:hypothetical protein
MMLLMLHDIVSRYEQTVFKLRFSIAMGLNDRCSHNFILSMIQPTSFRRLDEFISRDLS